MVLTRGLLGSERGATSGRGDRDRTAPAAAKRFPADPAGLHLVKLCVGVDSVDELEAWQALKAAERAAVGGEYRPRHVTRMWPRRSEALLQGGSLYWVIRGLITARQRIEALSPVTGADGIARCGIVLSPTLVRVEPRSRRPFQGWRYLAAADAPADLPAEADPAEPDLPPELQEALGRFGVARRIAPD